MRGGASGPPGGGLRGRSLGREAPPGRGARPRCPESPGHRRGSRASPALPPARLGEGAPFQTGSGRWKRCAPLHPGGRGGGVAGGSPVERRLRRCRAEERLPRRGSERGCRRQGQVGGLPGAVSSEAPPGAASPLRLVDLPGPAPLRLCLSPSRQRFKKGGRMSQVCNHGKKHRTAPFSGPNHERLAEPRFCQSLPRARAAAAWGRAGKGGRWSWQGPSLEEEARLAVPDQEPGGGKERAVGPAGLAGGRRPTTLPALSLSRGELEPYSRGVLRWQL